MPSVQAAGMWEPDMMFAGIAVAGKAADMQAVWVVELDGLSDGLNCCLRSRSGCRCG